MLILCLLIAAFICATAAAFRGTSPWVDFGWLALALFLLTLVIDHAVFRN